VRVEFLVRCALVLVGTSPLFAQQFPLQLLVTETGNAITLQNGGTISFNSPIGQAQTASITATYSGAGQVAINQPTVFGSNQFTVTTSATLPENLTPGQNVTFTVQFLPTSAAQTSAQVNLLFTETVAGTSSTGSIIVGLLGSAPSFALSYVLQATANVTPLQPGGTLTFPPTQVNTIAQAALNVTNTGSGTGVVTGISITGSAFTLSGRPLFPANIASGQTLQVLILYQPSGSTTDTGQVQVTFAVGSPVTINLQGSGNTASFVYQVLQTNPPTTVPAGGTLTLPGTNVGQTSSVVIRVLNMGNASGSVTTLAIAGAGFQLSNQPPLPQTLAPNASLTFTVVFAPTQPGTLTGTLLINADTITLSGVGLGSQLVFSYVAGGSTIVISTATPSVVFSPVMISQSAQLSFDIKNAGTLPATISNIGIGQSPSPYTITGAPPLPVTVAPNGDFHITIVFTPTLIGFSNGTLQLDATTVPLVGSGTQPPPLPAYTISGGGTAAPFSQPGVSLTLSAPYPVAIAGTLTLTIATTLVPDPAVQFSSGGLSVSFTIPANSTSAVFSNQSTQIQLQTGTVASTLNLAPSFATQAGGVDLTPVNPTTLQLTVAAAAPTLLTGQIGSVTTNGFVLTLTGFSTTRSLSTCTVQFTAATGFNFPATQFSIDLTQISTLWFENTASKASGGQFSLTIPFVLQGTPPAGQTLVSSISSVSATISNGTGASNTLQANVP
jgi:hypothetical protein